MSSWMQKQQVLSLRQLLLLPMTQALQLLAMLLMTHFFFLRLFALEVAEAEAAAAEEEREGAQLAPLQLLLTMQLIVAGVVAAAEVEL
jgi:hypothetical protein